MNVNKLHFKVKKELKTQIDALPCSFNFDYISLTENSLTHLLKL